MNVDDTTAEMGPSGELSPQPAQSSLRRWGIRIGFFLWIAAVVLTLGPKLLTAKNDVGPVTLSMRVSPSLHGGLAVDVPPSGRVLAPTHKGPVEVGVKIEGIDDGTAVMSKPSAKAVKPSELKDGLISLAVKYALIAVFGSVFLGMVAAAVLPKRSKRSVLSGGAAGLAATLLLVASMVPGFDPQKFKASTAEGALASSAALVNSTIGLGSIDKRVTLLSDRFGDLYSSTLMGSEVETADTIILHASDIHLNPIGIRMARQIAFEVSANAIIDTGDTTSFGIPAEKGFTDLLSDMGAPYYYAAGNHDSPAIREQIKRTKGVLPLGGRTYKVGAVTIAGIDDPTFSALQKADREKWTAQYKANDANTLALLDSTHPDLLAVHNPVMAKVALGKVPTIIAGHTHKYSIGTKKGTVLAVDGSSGATGLGSLISKATIPYAFEILRYKGTKLLAIDRVEFEGLEGRFSVERVLSGSLETEILDKLLDESEPEVLASTSLESPEDIDKQLASLGLSDAIEAETTEPDPATTVAPADGVTTTTTTTAGP